MLGRALRPVTLTGACALLGGASLAAVAPSGDRGKDTYCNPILWGDYSDPDAVRVGDDYYLVASSFTEAPGLPILHSRDLVTWRIIGHALPQVSPPDHYATPRPGGGVWAPAIRFHDGRFMIYYPDPDFGIFVVSAKDPRGPWSAPVLVDDTRGAIDPAPFWDEDGKGWLVHGYAASRAGINNRIVLKPLDAAGLKVTGEAVTIVDGNAMPAVSTSLGPRPWQTTEGPKLYKRDGWYYIFAPSGGVKGGWQGVFRSRAITGPYEGRNVMDQGQTAINGPHQGAWITTPQGEDWFLHFQDRDTYGRVVHLQPMQWAKGWPVIGADPQHSGRGQPVGCFRRPQTGNVSAAASDDPLADWSFTANPRGDWLVQTNGRWRLSSVTGPADLYENGAVLSRRFAAPRFSATTHVHFAPLRVGERAGLAVHGQNFGWIGLEKEADGLRLVRYTKDNITPGAAIQRQAGPILSDGKAWLRITVEPQVVSMPPPDFTPYWPSSLREERALVRYFYSLDGTTFQPLGDPFEARPGRWVGARIGLFAQAPYGTPAATATTTGYAEFAPLTQTFGPPGTGSNP